MGPTLSSGLMFLIFSSDTVIYYQKSFAIFDDLPELWHTPSSKLSTLSNEKAQK